MATAPRDAIAHAEPSRSEIGIVVRATAVSLVGWAMPSHLLHAAPHLWVIKKHAIRDLPGVQRKPSKRRGQGGS